MQFALLEQIGPAVNGETFPVALFLGDVNAAGQPILRMWGDPVRWRGLLSRRLLAWQPAVLLRGGSFPPSPSQLIVVVGPAASVAGDHQP